MYNSFWQETIDDLIEIENINNDIREGLILSISKLGRAQDYYAIDHFLNDSLNIPELNLHVYLILIEATYEYKKYLIHRDAVIKKAYELAQGKYGRYFDKKLIDELI